MQNVFSQTDTNLKKSEISTQCGFQYKRNSNQQDPFKNSNTETQRKNHSRLRASPLKTINNKPKVNNLNLRKKIGKLINENAKEHKFYELMNFNLDREFTIIEKQMSSVHIGDQALSQADKKDRIVTFSLPNISHS